MADLTSTLESLRIFTEGKKYNTIYADPTWDTYANHTVAGAES